MFKKSLSYPHLFWMVLFVVAPMLIIFLYAFTFTDDGGEMRFTLENFAKFVDPMYIKIFLNSLWVSLISVLVCLLLGYPAALILANKDRRRMSLGKKPSGLLMLFIMPMWMNVMLKLYSWLTILNPGGLLNSFMNMFGFENIEIMHTYTAVVLGIVYDYIPFMILPIYSVLIKIDSNVIEAAQDLGAGSGKVFSKVILPLSLPGVVSGITMVFLPALTSFYIVDFLGGGKFQLVGNVIENNFINPETRNFGSALSIILMICAFISMYMMKIFNRSNRQMSVF